MAYLHQQGWRDRPGAVIGVITIHAVIGYALITGLKGTTIFTPPDAFQGYEVEVPITPPPPPPEPQTKPDRTNIGRPITVPLPPLPLPADRPPLDSTTAILPPLEQIVKDIPGPTPVPSASPSPKYSTVPARPRGNPGSWVTTADYRSSWINREMVGTARFRLEVAADGKVQDCAITGSSGYAELDQATCDLVTRRARFDPAKDETGARTRGSYTSAVRWELPE